MSEDNSLKSSCEVEDSQIADSKENENGPETEVEAKFNLQTSSEIDSKNDSETVLKEVEAITHNISIQFDNTIIANLYKPRFLKFLNTFPEFQVLDDGNLVIDVYRDENLSSRDCNSDIEIDLIGNKTPSSLKKIKKHSKVKKELFVVDATPSETIARSDLRYTAKFTVSTEKADENTTQNSKLGCFNCGALHSLKDCREPKDFARIAAARQKYKSQSKTSRYHLDEEKYCHLQPGKISKDLRQALGLQKNEVPHYIYLMRKLGYPPGWLEEAKFVNSNLDIFDIDGKNVKHTSAKKFGLDEDKIIEYPGFNIPLQDGVRDDYRIYRVPPYSDNFSKQAMLCFFEKHIMQEKDDLDTCDMDIDNNSDTTKEEQDIVGKTVGRNSPSLIDLEQQKLQLLEELNEESKEEKNDANYDSDKSFLAIKTSCFGTPLLKSTSPYAKLPNPENFSKDVSPVINFENLPNSTGKYEQLSDVLQKVRDTLKKVST